MNCAQQLVAPDRAIESPFEAVFGFVAFFVKFGFASKPRGG